MLASSLWCRAVYVSGLECRRTLAEGAGEGTLVTTWQIDNDLDVPRLITNWLEVYQ